MKLQLISIAVFMALATLYIQQQDQNFQEIDTSDLGLSDDITEQDLVQDELLSETNLELPQPIIYGIVSKRQSNRWCTQDKWGVGGGVDCDSYKYLGRSQFRFYKINDYYLIRANKGYCQQRYASFGCDRSYDDIMKNGNQSGQWVIEQHGNYRAIRNKASGDYLSAQYIQNNDNQQHNRQLVLRVNRNKVGSWEKFKLIEK